MPTGDITKSAIDTLTIDTGNTNPIPIHCDGDVYAVAYVGPGTDGWIKTFACDSDGELGAAAIDSLEFDTVDCDQYHLDFKKISGTTYGLVYRGDGLKSYLKTITIQNDGTITGIVDSWEFNGIGAGWFPKLLQRSGTVWIIISTDNGSGLVFTTTINNDGTLGKNRIDFTQFLFPMFYVSIAYVTGDWHALAYIGASSRGYVASLSIAANGTIAAAVQHSAQFDSSMEAVGNIVELATNYFAFPYDAASATLQTFSVSDAGSCALIDDDNFGGDADWSHIIKLPGTGSTYYAISWAEVNTVGQIKTYNISNVGIITTPYQDLWASFSSPGDDPTLLHVSGSVYMVAFIGSIEIWTFEIETLPDLSNDRIYVWLGDETTPEDVELTDPTYPTVLAVRTELGHDKELAEATAGICLLTCDNFYGDYSPELAGGQYYGKIQIGKLITVYEIYEAVTYRHFQGRIEKIEPHGEIDNPLAYITALDGFDDLAGVEINTVLRTNTDAGTLFEDVLDAANWSATKRSVDTGVDTLQLGWFHKVKALAAVRILEKIEDGRAYVAPSGNAVFENRHKRVTGDGLVVQHDFEDTAIELIYEYSKRLVYNEITVRGRRYFIGGIQLVSGYDMGTIDDDLIYSAHTGDSGAPYVPQGTTLTLWAEFGSPLESYTALAEDTHWNANTESDKSGTDVGGDIVLVQTQYGQSIKLQFTNNGTVGAYLVEPDSPPVGAPSARTILVYGVLYSVEVMAITKDDSTSQDDFGKRTLTIDALFKSNPNDILAQADYSLAKYKDAVPTAVSIRHNARTAWPDDTMKIQCLVRHISDRITVKSTRLGFDTDFYINQVIQDYILHEGGTVHETTWIIERADFGSEGTFWLLGVAGFGELGEVTRLGF